MEKPMCIAKTFRITSKGGMTLLLDWIDRISLAFSLSNSVLVGWRKRKYMYVVDYPLTLKLRKTLLNPYYKWITLH